MDPNLANGRFLSWAEFKKVGDVPALALLIYQSHPEFYDLFSPDRGRLLEAIRQQLEEPDSELGHTKVLVGGDNVAGTLSWYHTSEADDRKMMSLRVMLDVLEPTEACFEGLRKFKEEVPAIEADGCYLSRIAVAESRRGTGLGQVLLRDFEDEAQCLDCRLAFLHVWRTNSRAIRFYSAAGYQPCSPPELAYLTMSKSVASPSLRAAG
jgi:ribosomal protein S18 acetylase RimI-like enzyme